MLKLADLQRFADMSRKSEAIRSLAILPFHFHQEKETGESLLGAGLADSLSMRLFGVEGLNVRPTSSVRQFLSQTSDSFALGKLLQVEYILEGFIFPSKERTRFTVQLLNVPDRSVVWAAQFDEAETDVFRLEDLISERVFRAVLPFLQTSPPAPHITDSVATPETSEVDVGEVLSGRSEKSPVPAAAAAAAAPPGRQFIKKSPAYRFPLIVLLILTSVLGGFFVWRRAAAPPNNFRAGASPPAILVLPFQNLGMKPGDNALGTGLAETLAGNLGNTRRLFVLSANAGRGAARAGISPFQIGQEYKVDYILRGTIQYAGGGGHRGGGDVQASAELIETKSGKPLWSKMHTVSAGDVSNLQAQITQGVLEALSIEITAAEKQEIAKRQTNNGVAYEFYLAGRSQMASRTHEGLHRAITYFSQAIERDPEFALAYVGLADAYALENIHEIPPPADAYEKAKRNALQALTLDENLAEAHASLAYILSNGERNWQAAEQEFRRAIELNPSYATGHHWFAIMLSMLGRHAEALSEIELAQRLDPFSAVITSARGMTHFYARQYPEAVNEYEKTLLIDKGFVPGHKIARWTFQASNNYFRAHEAFEREKNFGGSPGSPGWLIIEAQVEAVGGNSEKARALLEKGLTADFVTENPAAFAYEIALAYSGLGEREKALEWLEKAEAVNNHSFNFIEVDPRLDNLRADKRFDLLARKLKNP